MIKLTVILFLSLFGMTIVPAYADWCQKPGGGIEPCGTIPSSWTECGNASDGAKIHCYPAAGVKSSSEKKGNSTAILVSVGVGLVFVAVMWYFFGKDRSSNNPGQVKLMEF